MPSLMNFDGLRIRVLIPLMVVLSVFAVLVGIAGEVDAQTSRYTLDDVMDKLDNVVDKMTEMDKKFEVRLGKLETRVDNLEAQIADLKIHLDNRINTANTITISFFTVLAVLFGGILVSVLSIARNMRPAESSKAFRKELKAVADRERALEEKLQAEDRSVPRILEALEQKVSALAERQKELEGKLKLAEVI